MYIDANVFIFSRLNTDEKGENSRKILSTVQSGRRAITSPLVLDEVIWVLRRNKYKGSIKDFLSELYAIENLEVVGVSSVIPIHAVQIMEEFQLRPRDAFHIAIMRETGTNEIVTDDADFDRVKGIKRIKID
jgi:uncharacterized protein